MASCLLAVVVLVPVAGGHASADDGDLGSRLKTACLRIPPIRERVATQIAHLQGAADLKGSLAWLQTRINRASATNHPVLAADLQHRYDFRAAKLADLKDRLFTLEQVAQQCRSIGLDV